MRAVVIGVGHLGKHHARILAAMPGVMLAGVIDSNQERAGQIAAERGTTAYADVRDVPGKIDVAVVAVPTESHAAIATTLIAAGIHTLVEKPVTQTVAEADALIAAAKAKGVVFAVGHSERFNPAVAAARPYLQDPRFIEVHRLGQFPDRSLDIDVVLDLMIHERLHCQPHGQPHQPRAGPEDPLLPARFVRLDRHGRARSGDLAAGAAADGTAKDWRRQAGSCGRRSAQG